jgi:HEAT repeat protein
MDRLWNDLEGADAQKAYQAAWTLAAMPEKAVPLLRERLKPVAVAGSGKVDKWIADLDSDVFAVRQSAAKELVNVGTQVIAPIQKALKGNVSVETRRRLEQVLITVSDIPDPNTVRMIRAIMVLERIGSPEARSVLETLARGAPRARATEEAEASIKRLSKRVSPKHPS